MPSELQPIALQEEHDLESFAIERREAEQRQARPRASPSDALLHQRLLAPAVHPDPAGPVDLVEEPVHHDEQHDDGEQARSRPGRRAPGSLGEAVDDADGDEPGDERRSNASARAGRDRPLIRARADHVGGDGGEHEDALEPFAEHEHRDVEDARAEIAMRGRIGEPACAEELKNEDRRHRGGSEGEQGRGNRAHARRSLSMKIKGGCGEPASIAYIRPVWSSIRIAGVQGLGSNISIF